MLIEPGPIAPLDLAWFERALGILPPLDDVATSGQVLVDAADAMDAIVMAAGLPEPPDDVENEDTRALNEIAGQAGALADTADQGAPASVTYAHAQMEAELVNYEADVFGQSIIAVPGTQVEAAELGPYIDAQPDVPLPGDDGGVKDGGGGDGGGGGEGGGGLE